MDLEKALEDMVRQVLRDTLKEKPTYTVVFRMEQENLAIRQPNGRAKELKMAQVLLEGLHKVQ